MSLIQPNRRQALQGLGGVALSSIVASRAWGAVQARSLNFLAVGDWGREGRFHQRDVAVQMDEFARELDARFVISVGDNFYQNGVLSVDDPQWKASFEDVYDAPSLQVPWYAILGNHDYRGNAQAQLDYSRTSARWRLPNRWYKYSAAAPDGAQVEFFLVDTSPMISAYYEDGAKVVKVGEQKANVPVQLAWLDAALASSRADWKIVVGHHPIYSGKLLEDLADDKRDGEGRIAGGFLELMTELDPILKRHRVALYMNGHDHDLQHIERGGTHYVCTGAGSEMSAHCDLVGSDFCSLRSGFVACSVNGEYLHVAYRDYTGARLHVVDIPRPI